MKLVHVASEPFTFCCSKWGRSLLSFYFSMNSVLISAMMWWEHCSGSLFRSYSTWSRDCKSWTMDHRDWDRQWPTAEESLGPFLVYFFFYTYIYFLLLSKAYENYSSFYPPVRSWIWSWESWQGFSNSRGCHVSSSRVVSTQSHCSQASLGLSGNLGKTSSKSVPTLLGFSIGTHNMFVSGLWSTLLESSLKGGRGAQSPCCPASCAAPFVRKKLIYRKKIKQIWWKTFWEIFSETSKVLSVGSWNITKLCVLLVGSLSIFRWYSWAQWL